MPIDEYDQPQPPAQLHVRWHAEVFLEDAAGDRSPVTDAEFGDEHSTRAWLTAVLESFCYIGILEGPDRTTTTAHVFSPWEPISWAAVESTRIPTPRRRTASQ